MFDEPQNEDQIDINLTPIINIIFLLLIFFIVQGSVNQDVLPIDAPFSKNGQVIFSDPVEILVAKDELILNLELVEDAALQEQLQQILVKDSETEIMLKADAKLPASRMVEVLGQVQKSGAKNIFLVTAAGY